MGVGAKEYESDEGSQSIQRRDIRALMEEIRAEIRRKSETERDPRVPFQPYQGDVNGGASRKAGELVASEHLRYLNVHHAYGGAPNFDSISTHRRGPIGKLIVRVKRRALRIIWDLLKDYFASDRDYRMHLVRYLNDVSRYVDARDFSNFWELIRKIDYDVNKALERIERIHDEQSASQLALERRLLESIFENLGSLRTAVATHGAELSTLDSVVRGIEGILANFGKEEGPKERNRERISDETDYSYLLLENRFRGSEAEITERLSIYPSLFTEVTKPVLEIGCGRGELQVEFRKHGVSSYGVDLDSAMIQRAQAKGIDARLENGLSHLESLAPDSLGGLIAIQVVEHLSRHQLQTLFRLSASRVQKGGKIAFETINPRSLLALSSNYFRDPTHVWPLHPDTLAYGMELAGLKVKEVRMLSPVSPEAQLRELPVEEYVSPKWAFTLDALNRNIRQLNDLIYGYQDYCVIAERG